MLQHPEMASHPLESPDLQISVPFCVQSLIHPTPPGMAADSGLSSRSVGDMSNNSLFTIDEFGYSASLDYAPDNAIPPLKAPSCDHLAEQRPSRTKNHARSPKPAKTRIHAPIRPLARKRPVSGKAGDVTSLDHWIANHGGTTSTYEELPHRIQSSTYIPPQSLEQRVEELTREKSFLLQELVYVKTSRAAEAKFFQSVSATVTEMGGVLARLKDALDERSRARMQAEVDLCSYWGIHFGDGNVEDAIF